MIEFVRQIHMGIINEMENIPLHEVNDYFMHGTDGGAHAMWLESLNNHSIRLQEVSLWETVNGMMKYSSNANYDFLLFKIGIENLNQHLQDWIPGHDPCYPILSYLSLIAKHGELIKKTVSVNPKLIAPSFRKMMVLHLKRLREVGQTIRSSKLFWDRDIELQKIFSSILPRASASAYFNLIQKINQNNFEPAGMQSHILKAFDWILELDRYQGMKQGGEKTGHTANLFNKVMFARNDAGFTLEMIYLIEGISAKEREELYHSDHYFSDALMLSDSFRNELVTFFNKLS